MAQVLYMSLFPSWSAQFTQSAHILQIVEHVQMCIFTVLEFPGPIPNNIARLACLFCTSSENDLKNFCSHYLGVPVSRWLNSIEHQKSEKTWFRARFLEIFASKSTGNLILTYLALWIFKIGPMVPKLDEIWSGAFTVKPEKAWSFTYQTISIFPCRKMLVL